MRGRNAPASDQRVVKPQGNQATVRDLIRMLVAKGSVHQTPTRGGMYVDGVGTRGNSIGKTLRLQQFLRRELIEISQRSTLEAQLAAVLDSLPALRISDTEIEALLNDARAERDE